MKYDDSDFDDIYDPRDEDTGSHPVIQYKNVPIVVGPLFRFNQKRGKIVEQVAHMTADQVGSRDKDVLLGETLYLEKLRMRRINKISPEYWFNHRRHRGDRELWGKVAAGMRKAPSEADREQLLHEVLHHYADEIAGHFNPKVYRFATHAVPWFFSWLLNAASVKRFIPWGMKEALQDRLRILGEIPTLQNLAKKGTILLVPTHQSNIDSVLIGYVIYMMSLPPFCYGAGLNLFTNPVLNFFMSNLGAYTVDRSKNAELYKLTLKNYSTRVLRAKVHSIFFPGGGRSRSGAIESRLKLGLLGTGLEAEIENWRRGVERPRVYVVPMVTSYHYVLEASSLIEQYLRDLGKHRFLAGDKEETPPLFRGMKFFWKFFSSQSAVTVRIGKPLDIFGNPVDEEGESIGPNGTRIDPRKWLTTQGELRPNHQRDNEYIRELGSSIVERYHRENTVLTSHLLAFSYFSAVRRRYPDLDLFRFLRLSKAQRTMAYRDFLPIAESFHQRVIEKAHSGELFISEELQTRNTEAWIQDGLRNLGLFHSSKVVRIEDDAIWTDDMNLLYYYRNRLAGYGLSLLAEKGRARTLVGDLDERGFLA